MKTKKKLTKKQIKMIATIHSAIHLAEADFFMFDQHCNATVDEQSLILKEIYSIAEKLSKGEAMNLGSTENIINYVRRKF